MIVQSGAAERCRSKGCTMKKRTVSLAKYSWMGLLLAGSVLAVLAGCGGDDSDKSSAAEPSMETSYASKEDLPSCTSKREATIESTDDGKMYVCYDDSWKKIDYTESEVENLPSCTEKRNGSVAFLSSTDGFVVCKNEKWQNQKNTDSDEVKESSSSVSPSSSGDVDEGSENGSSSSSAKTSYVEVKTKSDLIECNASNKDVRALVLKDSSYYTCNAKEWKKDEGYLGYDVVADRENLPMCNAGNAKQRTLAKKDSVFFVCDSVKWVPEHVDGYLVQNASILGAAHKGPFKFDSPLLLREMLLRNDSLIYSGREYADEISSNKGDFVIPKVNMVYPYAELEVRGLWRNEITGDWSKDSMTLRVLTDLTKRTDVNINLLTHLEYDRAVALVNKGYSVYAAKKQADYEIMTALGFATTVEYSENLKTFVASTNSYYDANSTLMAISLLFIGNRSEAEIQKVVDEFRKDVADDGEWNGATAGATKAKMADWAESFDATPVRANVKTWNIVDVPSYENYLTIFWNNAYGLGGCASTRYGVVSLNTNKSSQNYNVHYICEANGWRKATDFEKDTYEWSDGKSGEVKKGNVTETYYVFENGKWNVAERETSIGLCENNNAGVVNKFEGVYYICKNNAWEKATVLEYDTYGKSCLTDGTIVSGEVVSTNKYVCDADVFRIANDLEISLDKGCVSYTEENEIRKHLSTMHDSVYSCNNRLWNSAIKYFDLIDSRDGKTYKTIVIGSQIWMAENLNYSDSLSYLGLKGRSWCYENSANSCAKYGRLYTWAAAMDSAGTFSTNGKGCGSEKTCSPTYPVRGICPDGWHLPTKEEWLDLFAAIGGSSTATCTVLKSTSGWIDGNGSDDFGFSALPAGYRYSNGNFYFGGSSTYFWSATEYRADAVYDMILTNDNLNALLGYDEYNFNNNKYKLYGISVRCLKNSY